MNSSVLKNAVQTAQGYLHDTDANMVFNVHLLEVEDVLVTVRGMIGVREQSSEVVEGGFCWGEGDTLSCLLFAVRDGLSGIEIKFLEMPVGWSASKAEKHVRNLIQGLTEKLRVRMVQRSKKRKSGGSYTGPRLEARKRGTKLPANKFAGATHLFTTFFAELAAELNVTYK
ncbi:MAG: hypothetical protein EOP06_29415 [Proteobacteria bacterium]|nr:MAG: hypothetical protein EOP06_29415 [Pseudomonadota bacterium]